MGVLKLEYLFFQKKLYLGLGLGLSLGLSLGLGSGLGLGLGFINIHTLSNVILL